MDNYYKFIADLNKKFNIDLSGYKRPQMERRINSLMRILQIENYNHLLKQMVEDKNIYNRFVNHLTINVSEFFRNNSQWEILKTKIVPLLLENNSNLNIWSAGCSTGEEPYSLAMLLKEHFTIGKHKILASDFDSKVLNKAQLGAYTEKEINGIPDNYRKKYLVEENSNYTFKKEIKQMITFQKHNLLTEAYERNFDLILCRNVVIYFTEDTKKILYEKFYNSLIKNGILFTGSTEQILNAREIGFNSLAIFFYQKK